MSRYEETRKHSKQPADTLLDGLQQACVTTSDATVVTRVLPEAARQQEA